MNQSEVRYLVGIDEAGRGPIAGPITLGAVALPIDFNTAVFEGVRDSKKLPAHKREYFYALIRRERDLGNIVYAARSVGPKVIDEKGIVYATKSALREALRALKLDPRKTHVLLDGGLRAPETYRSQETIIRGDSLYVPIMLASIVAKVTRDKKMVDMSSRYPEYAFERHKGYGTEMHYKIIQKLGLCDIHRKSFITA